MNNKTDLLLEPLFVKAASWFLANAAAFAGAVVSLAFVGQLTARGRAMAVTVGALTSIFVAPAINDGLLLWWADMPATFGKLIAFFVALSSMGALPKVLKAIDKVAGDPFGLLLKIAPRPSPEPPATEKGDAQ